MERNITLNFNGWKMKDKELKTLKDEVYCSECNMLKEDKCECGFARWVVAEYRLKQAVDKLKEKYRYRRIHIQGTTVLKDIKQIMGEFE